MTNIQRTRGALLLALLFAACVGPQGGGSGGASSPPSTSSEPTGLSGFALAEESPDAGPRVNVEIVRADHMLRGISLAGAEFGEGKLPGSHGKEYVYPDPKYANGYSSPSYFAKKGMSIFRLPFRWERLQPVRNKAFDPTELERLQTTVANFKALGVKVVLDPHNYARYQNELIGSEKVPTADFVDFWKRLATLFKGDDAIIFGLMNEPHTIKSEQWRDAGAKNLILVPGNGWSGAHSWTQNWYGTPNAELMLTIKDSADNYAFEVHQYMDKDSSGSADECVSEQVGAERMKPFTDWAKQHKKRGFLGEFNGGNNSKCEAAVQYLLNHVESNPDVYIGWTWWAAGPWWGGSLRILEPKNGQDAPQMRWIEPRLKKAN
jgi:endoglucanase